MKQPHYITSQRLEDILEQQFGLYHRANRSHVWDLSDLLKQQYDVDILYRIYEEGPISDMSLYPNPYIPITGAIARHMDLTDQPKLAIPEKNFDGCISWYITDTAQWILWVQSAQDTGKVWAWEMNLDRPCGIQPFCESIRSSGWWLEPNDTLRRHIGDWEEICDKAHEAEERVRFMRQFPITPDRAFTSQPTMQATQRIPTFAVEWPPKYPELDKMEEDIMKQVINSYR